MLLDLNAGACHLSRQRLKYLGSVYRLINLKSDRHAICNGLQTKYQSEKNVTIVSVRRLLGKLVHLSCSVSLVSVPLYFVVLKS